jgi:hypothetical protein
VADEIPTSQPPLQPQPRDAQSNAFTDELGAMEEEERQRLLQEELDLREYKVVGKDGSATTEWLKATRWNEQFQDYPVKLIAASKHLSPASVKAVKEYTLGELDEQSLVSSEDNEKKICIAANAVDQVVIWCEKSLQGASFSTRCWLRTHSADIGRIPFNMPQSKVTMMRYWQSWRQFIAFRLLVWCLGSQIQERVYGFQFKLKQKELMDDLIDYIDRHMG